MILRFLRLFRVFCDLEIEHTRLVSRVGSLTSRLADTESQLESMGAECRRLDQALAAADAKYTILREICDDYRKDADADRARIADLTDRISNAGDSVNLSLSRRRLFSKAPVEVAPVTIQQPVNISSGAGKQLARDRRQAATQEFFKSLAGQTGVTPPSAS